MGWGSVSGAKVSVLGAPFLVRYIHGNLISRESFAPETEPQTKWKIAILTTVLLSLHFLVMMFDGVWSWAEDQNFARATWNKSSPALLPCLLPSGKYVVTGMETWRILSSKDWGWKICSNSQTVLHFSACVPW